MDITLPATLKYFVETRSRTATTPTRATWCERRCGSAWRSNVREANVVLGALIANSGNAVDGEIETDVFLVMMEAAKSAGDDLKMIMAGVKAKTAAKARLRDLIRKVARDVRKNAAATEGEASLRFLRRAGKRSGLSTSHRCRSRTSESPSGAHAGRNRSCLQRASRGSISFAPSSTI
jgi:hypothetical protein